MATVLVVDDDPEVRELLHTFLGAEGFTVLTAANGSEALQQIRTSHPPSVILLDLMMPVMDGVQFRREQQREPRLGRIPVLCLSAQHDADRVAAHLGIQECIRKPFELDLVADAVRRLVARGDWKDMASPSESHCARADARRLLQANYLEMPGLALTVSDASRLVGITPTVAASALTELEQGRFLARTGNKYRRVA